MSEQPSTSRARQAVPGLAVLLVALGSCVEVDGGAVEFAWVLRTQQGRAISSCSCTNPPVKWVRLRLHGNDEGTVAGTTPCEGREDCRFDCSRSNGATPLDIPAGLYDIAVEALDDSGAVITQSAGLRTPEVIVRDVQWGQSVDLGAVQIVAACADRCLTNISDDCSD